MKSIAMFNNKGGVGKTTLVCNLASHLALKMKKKVLVIDADPQCNSTTYLLNDDQFELVYYDRSHYTVYDVFLPVSKGIGYTANLQFINANDFGISLLPGDPRLGLMEDLLSVDWRDATGGSTRGLRTVMVFSELLSRCGEFDFVFFDMGPSLGSINRSILLACDFFITPMSSDIFSLLAVENIGKTLQTWKMKLKTGINNCEDIEELSGLDLSADIKFVGYVSQQYTARSIGGGERRAVKAYDKILVNIPEIIKKEIIDVVNGDNPLYKYDLGSIPNFNSLIPMSQASHKPVFALGTKDGIVGAHFSKVSEFMKIMNDITENLLKNLESFEVTR